MWLAGTRRISRRRPCAFTVPPVAEELGVSAYALRQWSDRYSDEQAVTLTEHEELRELRRENRILREEREILRKAAVDSRGGCNDGFLEHSCWGPVGERFTGSGVQLVGDLVQVVLGEH